MGYIVATTNTNILYAFTSYLSIKKNLILAH